MAAAEYFTHGGRPSGPYLPPPQPQRASSNPKMNFGQSPPQFNAPPFPSPLAQPTTPQLHPPPPYGDELRPGVHFAPPPAELPSGRHSFSGQRPNPQQWNQPYFPPPTSNPGYNQQLYPYRPQYGPPARPYDPSHHSNNSGYSSDPESTRRHKHSDKRKRRISESSRSANADGFIGAAGGGLIGDLIFPGLGTAAGALAGWFGGKDYGQHRISRQEKRYKEQEKWERKYGPREQTESPRRRSRDHSRDDRRRSRDHSRDERRRSHDERRKSEY